MQHCEVEYWRPVYGYTGRYEVSNLGRVRNARTGHVLRPRGNLTARQRELGYSTVSYLQVCLCRAGRKRNHYVHALVLRAFVGPRPRSRDVNHLDSDSSNNRLDNLEYRRAKVNRAHHKPDCLCCWCRDADVQDDGGDFVSGVDVEQRVAGLAEAPF